MKEKHWNALLTGVTDEQRTQAMREVLRAEYSSHEALEQSLDNPKPPELAFRRVKAGDANDKEKVSLLAASLARSAKKLTSNWLSRHIADVLVIAAMVALATLTAVGCYRASLRKADLAATRDLQPFVPLVAEDVEAKSTKNPTELVANVVGRYPASAIKKGATVDPSTLSRTPLLDSELSVVRIALKAKPAFDVQSLPASVDLVLSARGHPPDGTVIPAVLLALDADGVSATIGLGDIALRDAARFFGDADAYLARRMR